MSFRFCISRKILVTHTAVILPTEMIYTGKGTVKKELTQHPAERISLL